MNYDILTGDAVSMLRTLPAQSVHCAVTSPPYYGLRDYGADGQIGLESSPVEYVGRLVEVFREVGRVLRDDGTLWVNIGDSYAANRGYQVPDGKWIDVGNSRGSCVPSGLKPKDLIGIPWRLAFALQDDGWYLRSEITWCKRAPMPESVQDRPTSATEKIFLLTKRARYFYDAVAVQEEVAEYSAFKKANGKILTENYHGDTRPIGLHPTQNSGRNLRNFWLLSPDPYPDAHFATFPREIPKRAILAGTSAHGCCPACGAPWVRVVERTDMIDASAKGSRFDKGKTEINGNGRVQHGERMIRSSVGFSPSCACDAGDPVPCTVLDPFLGSGTTVQVALSLGRHGVGVELNPAYVELAHKRISGTQPALMGL